MERTNSNLHSSSNALAKLIRCQSTATASDVGESLYGDDLEWDKSDFTRHLTESDTLSSYDVNEMAEILHNRFLEFDMLSQVGARSTFSRQSTTSEAYTPISNQDLTTAGDHKNSLTSDHDLSNETQSNKRSYHRSLPDVNVRKAHQNKSFTLSKHLSLECTLSKSETTSRRRTLTNVKCHRSFCSIPQSMEIDYEPNSFHLITDMSFARLSKLARIRLYLARVRDKLSSFMVDRFQSTHAPINTEEILETYDIIQG